MLLCAFLLSLPLWECGLKFSKVPLPAMQFLVTPLVGVWIEILSKIHMISSIRVTPLVGVWIEIVKYESSFLPVKVTPLVGVWIEITIVTTGTTATKSLPLWECGLKFAYRFLTISYWRHSPCGSVD